MIGDHEEPVNEEYIESNLALTDGVGEDEVSDCQHVSEVLEKLNIVKARAEHTDKVENTGLNLETNLNLSDYAIDDSLIKRMKKRQYDALDHSVKPEGKCAYYSIIYAILFSDENKPSPKWKMSWKGSEERLKPEIMAEIRPYKEQLKLCLAGTLMHVICELNERLEKFKIKR